MLSHSCENNRSIKSIKSSTSTHSKESSSATTLSNQNKLLASGFGWNHTWALFNFMIIMFFFSLYWRISWNISGEYFRPRRALIKDSWRIVRNDKSNDDWLDLQSEQFCKSRPVSFPGRRPLHPSHCEGNTFFGLLVKLLMFVLLLLFFCFCWHIFVPKIVVFIHCIYSIFMLLLLLLLIFIFFFHHYFFFCRLCRTST